MRDLPVKGSFLKVKTCKFTSLFQLKLAQNAGWMGQGLEVLPGSFLLFSLSSFPEERPIGYIVNCMLKQGTDKHITENFY